jgi:type IV secretory pathway TraG/TraD family ATPase VirD4
VGRGISLWIAIQSLSQLETVYGKARAQVLRDNMESQIYYRPADLTTAKYLEDRLGLQSAYAHSATSREGTETAQGLSERPVPLLAAQDISRLSDTEIIGFHRHLPPFRLTRMDWRQQARLQARARTPSPQLAKLPSLSDMPIVNSKRLTQDLIDPDMILSSKEKTILDLSNKQPEEDNLN